MIQWLRLLASAAWGMGSIPGRETKIPHAAVARPNNNNNNNDNKQMVKPGFKLKQLGSSVCSGLVVLKFQCSKNHLSILLKYKF